MQFSPSASRCGEPYALTGTRRHVDLLTVTARHARMVLEVVDGHETPFAIAAHGIPEGLGVGRIDAVLPVLQRDRHSGEFRPEGFDELVQGAQPPVGFPHLSEFAKGRLEIIGAFRGLPLIEESGRALRVGSAMEHVVAEEIAPRAELDVGHRVDGALRQHETVIVRIEHPAAHLAAGVRAAVRIVRGIEAVACAGAMQPPVSVLVGGGMLRHPLGTDAS